MPIYASFQNLNTELRNNRVMYFTDLFGYPTRPGRSICWIGALPTFSKLCTDTG